MYIKKNRLLQDTFIIINSSCWISIKIDYPYTVEISNSLINKREIRTILPISKDANLEVRFSYLQLRRQLQESCAQFLEFQSNVHLCTHMHSRAITREHKRTADIPGIDQDKWRLGTYHSRYAANSRCGTGRLSSLVSHEGNLLLLVGFRRLPTRGE